MPTLKNGISMPVRQRTEPANRAVLMIDYFFPPTAGAGVQRTLNYVKHLGKFGWSPIVLTVETPDHPIKDVSLLEAIPPTVNIQRTASLEPIRFLKRFIGERLYKHDNGRAGGRYDGRPSWRGARWIRDIEQWVLFPDRRIGWLPFAVARAIAISRRHSLDVIYSTSTIVTSHLIAQTLSNLLNKPWVADFQDWWVEDCEGPVHRWAGKRLEYSILRNADRTTFTTEPLRQMFHRKYPNVPLQKLVTIPMGFDPKAFEGVGSIPRSKFTIIHFGSFYSPHRSPAPFLEALAEGVKMNPGLARHVEVLFFGKFDAEMLDLAKQRIREGGLDGLVLLEGVVSYTAGLRQIMSGDLLLLVTAPGRSGQTLVPSKLFEYLAAGRPILALAPEGGGAAQIVREANAGVVVDPNDVRGIRDAILRLYQLWMRGRLTFPIVPSVVEKYTWQNLTGTFAATLEDALMASPKRHRRA